MQGPVLLTAIGFKPELVREPAQHLKASRIYAIATKHPKVAGARKALEEWSETGGVLLEVATLRNAFDFVEWHSAWARAGLEHSGKELFVNLTAGHGVAISTAAMIATQRAWPCVVYDDLEGQLHHMTPSILLKLHDLVPRDKEVLETLAQQPQTVGGVAQALDDKMSTISRSLTRLKEWGFLESAQSEADARHHIYDLRPGVKEFLATIIE